MEHQNPLHPPDTATECDVIILRCHDKVHYDGPMLARVMAGKSPVAADDMLCRILEHLAYWLDVLQQGVAADGWESCEKAARRIGLAASQIGLTGLAVAAGHVLVCLQARDPVALAATMGRLERAFDLAVAEVWSIRDG